MSNNNKDFELIEKMHNRPGEIILEDLIQQTFKIFANKLANGGIIAENEFTFQHELGIILKTLGNLYEFKFEDWFRLEFEKNILEFNTKSNGIGKKPRTDIFIKYQLAGKTYRAAIELKYFKKCNSARSVNRYKIFKDILKLELYKLNGIDICYFLLLTDDEYYVDRKPYSMRTADFDCRINQKYKKNTVLKYRTPNGKADIKLSQDYIFRWKTRGEYHVF